MILDSFYSTWTELCVLYYFICCLLQLCLAPFPLRFVFALQFCCVTYCKTECFFASFDDGFRTHCSFYVINGKCTRNAVCWHFSVVVLLFVSHYNRCRCVSRINTISFYFRFWSACMVHATHANVHHKRNIEIGRNMINYISIINYVWIIVCVRE